MAKKIAIVLLALLMGLTCVAQTKSSKKDHTEEVKILLEKMEKTQKSLKTLRVSFVQTNYFKMLLKPQTLKGVLTIKKPDTILYAYSYPSRLFFRVKNGYLLIYDPKAKKVVIQDIRRHRNKIIRYLGISQPVGKLLEAFRIEWGGVEGNLVHLELYPKRFRIRRKIAAMHFWVDKTTGLPMALEIVEPGGDRIRFDFSHWQTNPSLGKDAFKVVIPSGVRVQHGMWGIGETFKH